MLKEIFEQPDVGAERDARPPACVDEGTARLGGLNLTRDELRDIRRIIITRAAAPRGTRAWSAST